MHSLGPGWLEELWEFLSGGIQKIPNAAPQNRIRYAQPHLAFEIMKFRKSIGLKVSF